MASAFETELKKSVSSIAKDYQLKEHIAFSVWFAMNILQLSEDEAISSISIEGANDKGIDLFHVDDDGERVVIMQFKYSMGMTATAKSADISKLQSCVNWLSSPEALEKEGRKELAETAREYREARKSGYSLELWFAHSGPRNKNVEKDVKVYNQNPDNMELGYSTLYFPLDLIQSTFEEMRGSVALIPSESIELQNKETIETSGDFGEAIVAVVPANELVRLYEKHGDKLFDGNVRLSLGHRQGTVNAKILETLQDNKERKNFWAYNNGITFICHEPTVKNGKLELKNFSIINGCQTTTILWKSDQNLDDVSVLARFISPPQKIIDNVILFNNSQNPVRPWDIASRYKTQRRLVSDFKSLKSPIKYHTRRGPVGSGKKTKTGKTLPFEKVGQYVAAFKGDPVLAWKHKGFIFKSEHDNVFAPDVRAEEILFQFICGEVVQKVVSKRSKSDDEAAQALRRGGVLFVLATVAYILELRNGTTYLTNIKEERAASNQTKKRVEKYAEFALNIFLTFIETKIETTSEISAILKRREIFKDIKKAAKSNYQNQALAPKWLDEALPKILK